MKSIEMRTFKDLKIKDIVNDREVKVEKSISKLELGSEEIIQNIAREEKKKNIKEELKHLDFRVRKMNI